MAGAAVKFGLPPWLKRTREAARALVKYTPPLAADPTDADEANGWTAETAAAYHAERHAAAMAIVAASMEGRLRPRPRWANSGYNPLRWRG